MDLEHMGINPATKEHRKSPLTQHESAFLGVLWIDHVGMGNAMRGGDLARAYAARLGESADHGLLEEIKRDVRCLQNHLLCDHNIPVLSKAGYGGGYWIAASDGEADQFYRTFRKRGLTGLVKASRGKQSAMVDIVTQLSFQFDEMDDKGLSPHGKSVTFAVPTPIEVVDAFFKRMLENPEQYADGLRKIGDKYGSVLVPKGRFNAMIRAMKAKTAEMQELVASLER